MQLLAEESAQLGVKLVRESADLVRERDFLDPKGDPLAPLAIWHFTIIIADLASITQRPGPDKAKIFKQLQARYNDLITKTEPKLAPLVVKIGEKLFGVVPEASQSPLDLMGLLGGPKGKGPQIDMNRMMQMMSQLR